MKQLFKLLTIDEEFIFLGQRKDLEEILRNSDINYKTLSQTQIEFTQTISFGTMTAGGNALGINVRALLSDTDSAQIKIN